MRDSKIFMRNFRLLFALVFIFPMILSAQDGLLDLLEEEEEEIEIVSAAFKANRVINLHSIENTARGVLDFKISHRFGQLNGGISEFFGLDQASIRLGFDYGISDRLMVGMGRSSFEKTVDGFAKYRILRQTKGAKEFPVSLSAFVSTSIVTTPFPDPDRDNFFSSRLAYSYQLILARKFSDNVTLQFSPTVVHRNLVTFSEESNDVVALATAGRVKITKRLAINAEYIYVLPDQLLNGFRNSFSLGFDIETGGHVFQLHFTNSTSMIEKGFIAQTTGDWGDGGIHFGFNVSRVFTLKER